MGDKYIHRSKGFDVLRGVEIITNTIRNERDPEKLLGAICAKILEIFCCDRAWLLFPCDPEAPSWSVPVEQSVATYPGANMGDLTLDMTPEVAAIFRTALSSERPVVYGPAGLPLTDNTKSFQVQSQLSMAIYPRVGKPWQLGIHQCSYNRVWADTEIKLFQLIGIMTAEALGNILLQQDLRSMNASLEQRVSQRTEELNSEKEFAESLVETAQAIVLLLDTNGNIIRFNPYMEELCGYRLEEVRGKDWFKTFLLKEERGQIQELFSNAVSGVRVKGNINAIVTKDGRHRLIEWYDKPLSDAHDNTVGLLAIGRDVTERVYNAEKMRASLKEKEVLLQEIHHRVKNNMQVVSSLIGIQRSRIKESADPVVMNAFTETESRINSMALVHERLYRSADFAHIDFDSYIQQLAGDLFHTYGKTPDAVTLETQLENIHININQAIPCALIANELISNALKHGFPADRKGKISIVLRTLQQGLLELSVCDDGIGLPADFNTSSATSSGMAIINALVRQLGATLAVKSDRGACFQMNFNAE